MSPAVRLNHLAVNLSQLPEAQVLRLLPGLTPDEQLAALRDSPWQRLTLHCLLERTLSRQHPEP